MSSRSSWRGRTASTSWADAVLTTASADPANATVRVRPFAVTSVTPWRDAELILGDRRGEFELESLHRDLAEVLQCVDDDESPLAEDGEPMGDPLHLRQGVGREEHRATLGTDLFEEGVEALLHERVEARDRLVKDQQLRLMHERLHETELLAVTGRQLAYRPVEVGVEALGECVAYVRSRLRRGDRRDIGARPGR